jgi:hypothetical protein
MNKNNAAEFIPLVQALADGKTIQYRTLDTHGQHGAWRNMAVGGETVFGGQPTQYRVKPPGPLVKWLVVDIRYEMSGDGVFFCDEGVARLYISKAAAASDISADFMRVVKFVEEVQS